MTSRPALRQAQIRLEQGIAGGPLAGPPGAFYPCFCCRWSTEWTTGRTSASDALRRKGSRRKPSLPFPHDRVAAVLLAGAGLAFEAGPDGVELGDGRFHESGVIGEDAGLEVACAGAFHADAGAGEIGRADVRGLEVEDDDLEVHAGAEGPLQAGEEHRIAVEVLPEVRTGFLRMDQPYLLALADQVGQDAQEGPLVHVEVLDIGRADPERPLHLGHPPDHFLEVHFVGNVLNHGFYLQR